MATKLKLDKSGKLKTETKLANGMIKTNLNPIDTIKTQNPGVNVYKIGNGIQVTGQKVETKIPGTSGMIKTEFNKTVDIPLSKTNKVGMTSKIETPITPPTDNIDFAKGLKEGKITTNSNGEYLDTAGKVVGKVGLEPMVKTTNQDGTTTFDEQTNKMLEENFSYTDDKGQTQNIQFKDIYNALTPEQKKYYEDLGKAGAKQFKDALTKGFTDIRDIKENIELFKGNRDKQNEINNLQTESQNIQIEAENKAAYDNLNRLKQNIGFLGYGLGQPGSSPQRLEALQNQIKDQETTYGNIVQLNANLKKSRELGLEIDEASFKKQLKDLNQSLVDGVDKTIQGAMDQFNSYEIQGILDDPDKFNQISQQILSSMDKSISGLSDTAFAQKKFVLDSFNDLVTQKQDYLKNTNIINKDMSIVKGFYVDGNGNEIKNEFGQRIVIPQGAPMEPVFDKEKGVLYTFTKNDKGEIVANQQKLFDNENFDGNVVNGYISALQSGDLSLEGLLKSGIDKNILNQVVAQYNASGGNLGTQNFGTSGFSSDLVKKYPNEAAFKNNNPTGITWNKNFEEGGSLATLLKNSGVNFTIGTDRPKAEGGNYVKFNSVEDGMKAYETILTKASHQDVNKRLQQWVGTFEGPTYAANLMAKAGIPQGAQFSDLSETQLLDLMSAQLQKESPNFYKEVILGGNKNQGTQTQTSYTPLQEKMLKDFDGKDIGKLASNLGVNEKQARGLYNQYLSENQGTTDDEMNDKALGLIQGLGGTEGERAKLAENIVKAAKKDNITLQEAKKKLGYKTGDDVEFAKVRKEDIQNKKDDTLGKVSKARETLLALNSENTAVSDVMATVGFLKVIDPASVARESEVASVENARGIIDTIGNVFTKLDTGEKLTDIQREQLKDAIGVIVKAAEKNYYTFLNDTKGEFNDRGLDSSIYIGASDSKKAKDFEIVYSDGGIDMTAKDLVGDLMKDYNDGIVSRDEVKQFLIENNLHTNPIILDTIKRLKFKLSSK